MQETAAAPDPSKSLFELELNSCDDIMQEVEGYTETCMVVINSRPQGTEGDLSPSLNLAHTRSSSTGTSALTSDAQASTGDTRYICRDWVS